jgi:hypothetical protein
MYSAIASTIFAVRNVDKARHGDIGRSAVAATQGAGVISNVLKLDKIANVASKSVNPLIVVSGAIKVARSDDKITSIFTETGAIATMFAGEAIVKANYAKFVKVPGKLGVALKALAFVATSIGCYDLGKKVSGGLAKEVKANYGIA